MEEKAKSTKFRQKDIINIIRTTQRNNIELTHIADNKANVLLSLNALMVTFLLPLVLANAQMLLDLRLGIPILILAITAFVTIYISAIVLKPGEFSKFKDENVKAGRKFSPFFFGNFHDMPRNEFMPYMKKALSNNDDVKTYLADDLYYIGNRLGKKMKLMRIAFNIFMFGFGASILSSIVLIIIHH